MNAVPSTRLLAGRDMHLDTTALGKTTRTDFQANARVVEHMSRSKASVFTLTAPAGYGKTSAAQAFVQQFERVAWCDFNDVTTVKEFAAKLTTALAMDGGNDPLFTQVRHEVEALSVASQILEVLDRAWSAQVPASAVVFDNCERLDTIPALADLLYRSVLTAPPNRRVVVCSRTPLRIRPGRYLPPHRLLRITESDLRLTDEETRALLAGEVGEDAMEIIIARARGWPVVLLLLSRLAQEQRLELALKDSAGVQFDEFFEYFLNEVLAPLSHEQRRALRICAALPDVTEDELLHVQSGPPSEGRAMLASLPMVTNYGGRFSIHPMARKYILQADAGVQEVLAIAAHHEANGELSRAAQVYAHAQDYEAAARCLAALPVKELLTPANRVQLAGLPLDLTYAHPKLAAGVFFMQSILLSSPDRVRQTVAFIESAFYRLQPDDDPETIAILGFALAPAFWYLGLVERRERLLDDIRIHRALQSQSPLARILLGYVREWNRLVSGDIASRIGVVQEYFAQAQALQRLEICCPAAIALGRSYRWRGDRDASLRWLERGIQASVQIQSPVYTMSAVLYATTTAWFWDGGEGAKRFDEAVEDLGRKIGKRVNFALIDIDLLTDQLRADGVLVPRSGGVELLLMRIAHADVADRPALLAAAEHAITGTDVLTQALFYIARAAAADDWDADLRRAHQLACSAQAPEFRDAIEALIARRPSFLDGFVSGFRGSKPAERPGLCLDLLKETVTVASRSFRLTPREAALLTFLARQRIASPREEIQEAFWPDLHDQGARDALYSLIHRLRKRSAPADPIRNVGNAYAISDEALVDLWEIEELAKDVKGGTPIPPEVVVAAYETVRSRSWAHFNAYEWFALVDFRANEYERAFLKRLIQCAELEGDYSRVLRYANDAIETDPCDEWGYQMLMKAHMALGEDLEAARALRRYRETLRRELNAEPSEDMLAFARESRITRWSSNGA